MALSIKRPRNSARDPNSTLHGQPIVAFTSVEGAERQDGQYLKFDPGLEVSHARVKAVNEFFTATEDPPTWAGVTANGRPHAVRRRELLRDLLVGHGFPSLVKPLPVQSTMETAISGLERSFEPLAVEVTPNNPTHLMKDFDIDLYAGIPSDYKDALAQRIGIDTEARLAKYMKMVPIGALAIIGIPGSGKSQLMGWLGLLLMKRKNTRHIYISAPSNIATSVIANRVWRLAHDLKDAKLRAESRGIPLVVRGYRMSTEVNWFVRYVEAATGDVPMVFQKGGEAWDLPLSVCEWLLKVTGAAGFTLAQDDPEVIFALRDSYRNSERYLAIRRFVSGAVNIHEMIPLVPKDVRSRGGKNPTGYDLIEELAVHVVMRANAMCTNPFTSTLPPYDKYNAEVAKATILDEAGAMQMADALSVWRSDGRPVLFAGDPQKPPPTVMTINERRNGKVTNVYAYDARVSVLEQLKRSGYPIFVLL